MGTGTPRAQDVTITSLQLYGLGTLHCAAYSPDGNYILTGGGAGAFLWEVDTGRVVRQFLGHTQSVTSVAFSPDGTKVLTGSTDGTARLWKVVGTADKVILVAGGGNFSGNPIVRQTEALADRAFFACLVRGYTPDEVFYLSAFDDWMMHDATGDGLPDVDAYASTQTFSSAIDSWSSDTARLLVYLVDHGSYNWQTGEFYFRLNPTDYISASELDRQLDNLQALTGGEVILIVDCCYAGRFVQECAATTGTRRIVMAATTAQDLAIYTPPEGAESFSFNFLSFAIMGNTLYDCYYRTKLAFRTIGNPAGQVPWLDDNNDGVSDTSDGTLAARHVLGRYPAFGLNAPTILDVATTQMIAVGDPVDLWAHIDEASPTTQVWTLLIPEHQQYLPDDPVTYLTRVDLAPSATPNRWEATWIATEPGDLWQVSYFALSEDPLHTRPISNPKTQTLYVQGPTAATIPWHLMR